MRERGPARTASPASRSDRCQLRGRPQRAIAGGPPPGKDPRGTERGRSAGATAQETQEVLGAGGAGRRRRWTHAALDAGDAGRRWRWTHAALDARGAGRTRRWTHAALDARGAGRRRWRDAGRAGRRRWRDAEGAGRGALERRGRRWTRALEKRGRPRTRALDRGWVQREARLYTGCRPTMAAPRTTIPRRRATTPRPGFSRPCARRASDVDPTRSL